MTTLVSLLGDLAERRPDDLAFRFLQDGTTETARDWTYRDLAEHTAAVAAGLDGLRGKRVVLALDPGLDYVAAFFGILAAGATAVPCFPPSSKRTMDRFLAICSDCAPDLALTDARHAPTVERYADGLAAAVPGLEWRFVEDGFGRAAPGAPLPPDPDLPALLQYTSGSTGTPKGVALSHANLISNCVTLEHAMGPDPERVGCSWLPPYHDMGLMGTIILAVHGGWPLVMLAPEHFVQRPYRWLKAITDHRVTISVAPNFGLELSVASLDDAELADLDLGTLRQLFCGSEPVLPDTLEAFAERFAPCGYAPEAVIPCYGMAEATLFVSGKPDGTAARTMTVDKARLERGEVAEPAGEETRTLVSCGTVGHAHRVRIADPESGAETPPGRVGEIWVSGPSVALGYFGRERLTRDVFRARLPGDDVDHLRTGDLGFLHDGELYVTGRLKDLIVIAGRNLYPQDVEVSVQRADPAIRRTAAFSVPGDGGERLVVVAEVAGVVGLTARDVARIHGSVIAAVTADHGVGPVVHFGPVGTVPTTTSGKVRRAAARQGHLDGTLRALKADKRLTHV